MTLTANQWLDRIRSLPLERKIKIMNVCGGHERSITMAGLRSALPATIELIPGPGCPVCICPEEDIFEAIQLALQEDIILVAFGDMLRVPVNVRKGEVRTLSEAKALGADIRPIASPTEATKIARENPDQAVVFFAAGFETTTAPVAAMLIEPVSFLSHLAMRMACWASYGSARPVGSRTLCCRRPCHSGPSRPGGVRHPWSASCFLRIPSEARRHCHVGFLPHMPPPRHVCVSQSTNR